jgi:hypothetical protein
MSTTCPPLESFAELLRLDAQDPRRRHLEQCPRCRARMMAFRSFMEMEPAPVGADREDARRRLVAAIRRETLRSVGRAGPRRSIWQRRLPWPVWKPALGLVAAALLIVVLLRAAGDRGPQAPLMLRGANPTEAVARVPAATWAADGSAVLRWPAVPAADGYRVLVFDQDLQEIARLDAAGDTSLVLSPARLAALAPSGAALFWRVAALRQGDQISLSPPATLRPH